MRRFTVPDALVNADIDAAQIGETSHGGAKGAVPLVLLGSALGSNV